MYAFQLIGDDQTELRQIPRPTPGPGEVVLRVGAAAFCHSDVHHLEEHGRPEGMVLPVTMGHEFAGWVHEVGPDALAPPTGTLVTVYIAHGCGHCEPCARGDDFLCDAGFRVPGVHFDGGMAEFVLVRANNLVDASGLDVATAAVLTDAGVTAHHSVAHGLDAIGVRNRVLVIGIGGLGHVALQVLAALTDVAVIAVDVDARRLDLALRLGAAEAFSADDSDRLLGAGSVDAVYDFVGSAQSLATGTRAVRRGGALIVPGLGGGSVQMIAGRHGAGLQVPRGTKCVFPLLGSRADLEGVVDLARRSLLHVENSQYSLPDARTALDDLRAGRVLGRSVIAVDMAPQRGGEDAEASAVREP